MIAGYITLGASLKNSVYWSIVTVKQKEGSAEFHDLRRNSEHTKRYGNL